MHKKIHADLVSLAHSILQLKNKDDVVALRNKAEEVYQKLSVLSFVEDYFNTTPNATEDKEEVVDNLIEKFETLKVDKTQPSKKEKKLLKDITTKNIDPELFEKVFVRKENAAQITLEDSIKEVEELNQPKSLNDKLVQNHIQIGLNDRIAFVKHLFDGKQEDFNRVISQLNSFETEIEVIEFMDNFVKPDYNWEGQEEYIERFNALVTRKFL